MNSLYFWKSWNSPYKQLYFFLLSVFLVTLLALAYASYTGMQEVVKWEVETELEPVKVVVDQFARNLFNFTVESESFYALDKFVATEVQVHLPYTYLFLALITLGMVFILTTFSYLDLYWFMGGMLAFLFFLFSMEIEMLQLFGRVDRAPMVVIFLAYGVVSYVFNSFYKSASYLIRLCSFIALTLVVGLVIYRYSAVATPFLYLANFGSLMPVWVTAIFVLLIGYDIIKGFLYFVSSSKTAGSKNAVLNFIFASLLYLVNVFLLLLKKLYLLQLDIVYLNPFLLLVVSAVLGIWMFKKRTEMFSGVLPFAPAGAYVYLSLAIISISGAAYAFINGNIGILEAYERIIVYGHLFLGFVFLVYVLVNFGALFDRKISIYDIVYQPTRMTFLAVPAIAITISVFFFLSQKKYPYNLAIAGYYTYCGDVMVHEAEYPLAFEYYKTALLYDYPNHRANYSIASLSTYLEDKETAKGYFQNALYRDPSVQSYIGLSNVYMETGELFQALFNIQEALKKFPKDGRLYNNLGVAFYKANLQDSAVYYFFKARQLLDEKEVASSNVLYLMAKKNLIEEADSILQTENYPKHISFLNNKLAILNQLGKKSDASFEPLLVSDTVLNANTFSYLVNANLNSLNDTSLSIARLIDSLRMRPSNEAYKDQLTCQLALKKYYTGNRFGAIQDMVVLNSVNPESYEYPTLLGSWMLEQEQYSLSSDYYQRALQAGRRGIELNYALSSIQAGNKEDALFVLSQLQSNTSEETTAGLLELLSVNDWKKLSSLDESKQFQWFLFNLSSLSPEAANTAFAAFTSPVVRAYAGSELCLYYLERNNLPKADEVFSSIQDIQGLNPFVEAERNYAFLRLKTAQKEGVVLSQQAGTLKLTSDKELQRSFFIASAYALKGDSVQASRYYLKTISEAPYVEAILPEAIHYLSVHGEQQKAYDYLVEIVQNNPSVPIKKAYLELCLDMTLISYAESTLKDLKPLISIAEYNAFQQRLIVLENQ